MTDCNCRADAYEYVHISSSMFNYFPVDDVNELASEGFRVTKYLTSPEFGTAIILEKPLEA